MRILELTSTTPSRNKLLYLGYAYVKNKDLANGWVSFECERRRNYKGCTGRIKANGQQVVVVTNHTLTKSCSDINQVLNTLSNNIDHDLDIILDYIEDYYIGAYRRGHYRAPRFAYDMWGVCDRVQNELPRTNNDVEGWHKRFNRHVGCHHANLWKLIEVLKNEEDISQIELLHIQQGRVQQNANPVYARINARVNTVVNDYANRGRHLDCLRGIAYNITV